MTTGRYESSESSNVGTAITFLLIGLGAGTLLGMLLAPKTGKQLRRDLRRGYEDARENLGDWAEDAKGRVRDVGDRVRDVASAAPSSRKTFGKKWSRSAKPSTAANTEGLGIGVEGSANASLLQALSAILSPCL
jgi:gas vesicle protein